MRFSFADFWAWTFMYVVRHWVGLALVALCWGGGQLISSDWVSEWVSEWVFVCVWVCVCVCECIGVLVQLCWSRRWTRLASRRSRGGESRRGHSDWSVLLRIPYLEWDKFRKAASLWAFCHSWNVLHFSWEFGWPTYMCAPGTPLLLTLNTAHPTTNPSV